MSLLVIDKPAGPSSFKVLSRVKRALASAGLLKGERIGHGGTLDPFATGVLPICLGEGTKVLPYLLDADKEYEAILRLGIVTDSLDPTGQILRQTPVLDMDESKIREAMAEFRGRISQKPPMYSALKKDGQPLYKYARRGQEVERQPRSVMIYALELLAFGPPNLVSCRVRCSKGTYVRQLAADIGDRLGVGGHLASLRRTVSGPFHLGQSITPDGIERRLSDGLNLPFLSPLEALSHLPRINLTPEEREALSKGQTLRFAALHGKPLASGPIVAVAGTPSAIVAILEQGEDGVTIRRGFQPHRS